jgi:hypothetical protein
MATGSSRRNLAYFFVLICMACQTENDRIAIRGEVGFDARTSARNIRLMAVLIMDSITRVEEIQISTKVDVESASS